MYEVKVVIMAHRTPWAIVIHVQTRAATLQPPKYTHNDIRQKEGLNPVNKSMEVWVAMRGTTAHHPHYR